MKPISYDAAYKAVENYPVVGLLSVARAALGCGIGLIVADRFPQTTRQRTAIALLSVGVLGTAPWLVRSVFGLVNRPESARGQRRRLDSIRGSAGFDESEMF